MKSTDPNSPRWFARRDDWFARGGASVVERFWAKGAPEPNTGCLLWTGSADKDGYGKYQVFLRSTGQQVHVRAHVFAYALVHGWPCGVVMHTCDVPGCFNPLHLRAGSQAENIADKVAKGRQALGERHGNAVLCADDVRTIRLLRSEGLGARRIAAHLGHAKATVEGVLRGATWRHVS